MNPESILIIDDDPSIISCMKAVLTDQGHEVHSAESGSKGLDLLKEKPVAVIMSDLHMPHIVCEDNHRFRCFHE